MNESQVDTRPWLVAMDWQSRALLLAELAEHGIEVRTEPGTRAALRALIHERLAPPLMLLDTTGDPDADPTIVQRLLRILKEDGIDPLFILLTSTYDRARWDPFGERATMLVRPVTVGEIVGVVKQKLQGKGKIGAS